MLTVMENITEIKSRIIGLIEALRWKNIFSESDLYRLKNIIEHEYEMEHLENYWEHINSLYDPIGI